MSVRTSSRLRAATAALAAVAIATAVVVAQPGGSTKARADSPGPGTPDCCSHTHARAQAVVAPNGTTVQSFGVVKTMRVATGTYCIQLTAATPVSTTAPVASQDLSVGGSPATMSVTIAIESSAPDCTRLPNSVEVLTFTDTGPQRVLADEGFSVVIS